MKKLFLLVSLCALAFASCQKAELEEVKASEGKYTYTFVGTATPEVKASVGDKEDNKWPMLWEAGDKIGVYSADGATFIGVAEVAAEDAGKKVATFTLSTDTELTDGQALSIVYPYVEGGSSVVPTKQTIAAANSSAGIGANAMATATTTFAGEQTSFALTYQNAYLRFVLNSTEFKDYTLNGITLWAAGADLSGESAAVADYVKVTVSEPAVLGTGNAELWMTARPADLTEKKVWAIVHMTKGIETVTLPVELKNANTLPAQAVTSVELPALTKSLAPAWYEPIETRYIAAYGDGWCYGPENTIIFAPGVEQTVDLRARGNFMKVTAPAKVQLAYQSQLNNTKDKTGVVLIDDEDTHTSGTNNFTVASIGNDYAIKVKMNKVESKGHMAGMKVLDADNNVIWGTNLWLVTQSITEVQYDNGKVLTCNVGSDEQASSKTWRSFGAYFQWGRPWGVPRSTGRGVPLAGINAETNKADLAMSAANPYEIFYFVPTTDGGIGLYDWYYGDGTNSRDNDLDDLWGNPSKVVNPTTSGVKSIYDPCPAGYMVISPAILKEVEDGIDVTYTATKDANGKVTGATVVSNGTTTVDVTSTNLYFLSHKGVSWGFSGGHWASGNVSTKNEKVSFAAYWANSSVNTASYGRALFYQLKETDGNTWKENPSKSTARSKTECYPVRCMVDPNAVK